MNGLAIKDIEFNGSMLRAAQDIEGKIWVGIRWMCQGIGFNDGKVKTERKKIQEDLVLSQGKKFLPLGNDNANSDVLCLNLDYVPIWLAKISITPTMQKENPELVQKLITYQLKAKDVLAEAFLKKQEPVMTSRSNIVQLEIPGMKDYTEDFRELNDKFDQQYSDMSKLANIILDLKSEIDILKSNRNYAVCDKKETLKNFVEDDLIKWKQSLYSMMDQLIDAGRFGKRNDCLKYLYKYMTKNYGIVWEQEHKDYVAQNGNSAPTLDIIYGKDIYRSIFESVLYDLISESEAKENECLTDKIIAPLIKKYDDKSNAGCVTYKLVYARMDVIKKISWKNRETRYINKYGSKSASKKNIINDSKSLLTIFRMAVKQMMEE
mgnify:FL=1